MRAGTECRIPLYWGPARLLNCAGAPGDEVAGQTEPIPWSRFQLLRVECRGLTDIALELGGHACELGDLVADADEIAGANFPANTILARGELVGLRGTLTPTDHPSGRTRAAAALVVVPLDAPL